MNQNIKDLLSHSITDNIRVGFFMCLSLHDEKERQDMRNHLLSLNFTALLYDEELLTRYTEALEFLDSYSK